MIKICPFKKLVFLIVLMVFLTPSVFANIEVGDYSWSDKLSRGVLNVISSPVEIARSIHVTTNTNGPGYGWTVGLVKGVGLTVVRIGAGLVEIVTFPFDFPDKNKAPILEPEYPWQKWSMEYTR